MVEWSRAEMSGAVVPDGRMVKSLVRIVGALAEQPGVSFSAAVGHAGRQAARRITRREDVTVNDLLAGHVAETARRCQEYDFVLVPQDTSGFDFGSHRGTVGLGPTSNEPDSRGFFLHSALAVSPDGLPLGLLHAATWARDPAEYGKRETRQARAPEEKESYRWVLALQAVEAALPPQQRAIMLQDREGDIFAFLATPRRDTLEMIVRAAQPRKVEIPVGAQGEKWERTTLFKAAASLPAIGEMGVTIPRKPGKASREVTLQIRFTRLRVLPDRWRRVGTPENAQEYWLVSATEAAAPEGAEAIEWVLLTTLPVTTVEEACQIVRYYTVRWAIERLHYILKSGFLVERLQVDEAQALMKTTALYLPAAWRVQALTHVARTDPEMPAECVLNEDEREVLAQIEGRAVETVVQAVAAIAKLGGHVPYRKAPDPGVKRIWLGLRRLEAMVAGWQLARQASETATASPQL